MKFRNFLILVVLLTTGVVLNSYAQSEDKITAAVMRVYNEHIDKNPNDYNTLFMRANQHYFNKNLEAALDDVNRVIEIAPSKEKELLFDAYMLRASLHDSRKDFKAAADDLEKAAKIEPDNMALTDMKGKLAFHNEEYDVAKKQFEAILQRDARNADAMFMLGCVAAKQNNEEEAMNWVNAAVNLYTANPQVYLNRAYVQELLGKYRDASDTYLVTMSSLDDKGASLRRLFTLADSHYEDVMASLRSATEENPRVGIFYRLRSVLALKYNRYGQALRDLKSIVNNNLMESAEIYNETATCLFQLGNYDQAYSYANKAIAADATSPDGYILRSQIELRQGKGGNYATALKSLDQALVLNPDYAPALLAKARMLIAQKKYKDALPLVTKAVNADPSSADALMLRGWLNKNHLKKAQDAKADFERVLALPDEDVTSLRGFALHELGRDSEASAWAEGMISKTSANGGVAYYYAAALQAAMGNKAQGIKYLESCLANGYGGLYDINLNNDPYVNLAPLRGEASFKTLVSQSQLNFQER